MAGIGAVLTTTGDLASEANLQGHETQVLQQQALAVRDLVLGTPGLASTAQGDDVDWATAPDDLDRFGLRGTGDLFLDYDKLTNLRSAPYAADGNDGYVNYEEARTSLGLDQEGYDFHIRAYPSLRSVQELLETGIQDTNLRVTYIGDATGGAEQEVVDTGTTPPLSTPTCGVSPIDSRSMRIATQVENNGLDATQFHISFDVVVGNNIFTDVQRASTVAAGATQTIYVDVPARDGDCDTVDEVTATLVDPSASLSETTWQTAWTAAGTTTAETWFLVDPDYESYRPSDDIIITYAGDLTAKQGNTAGEDLTLQILDGATDVTPVGLTATISVPKKNEAWQFDAFPASDLGVGTYTVVLSRANGESVTDVIEVTAAAPGNYLPPGGSGSPTTDHTYSEAAQREISFLESLVARFCPYVWDSQTETPMTPTWSPANWSTRCNSDYPPHSVDKGALGQYGDVFPDDKQLLGAQLHERLAPGGVPSLDLVNTLVVGSNVDHNTMTSNAVKGAIRDWVTEAGGNLIVFGSTKQVVNWLNPIFKTKLDSSSNGISTPDADHPVLRVADDLSWDEYDDRGRAWELKKTDGTADSFTKVVHDNSADENAVLAISDPGAYGKGTVILTSWLPYDLFNDGGTREGLVFMNNLLMQGYRDLFIDYGPSIPDDVVVIPADGRAQVYHPELERFITLTLRVYVFPA